MSKKEKNRRLPSLNEVVSQRELNEATTKLENFVKRQVASNGDLYDLMPYIDQYLNDWKRKEKFANVELAVLLSLILFTITVSIATKNIDRAILPMLYITMYFHIMSWQSRELTRQFNYPQGALSTEAKRILDQLKNLYRHSNFSNDFYSIEEIFDNPKKIIAIVQETFIQENEKNEQAKVKVDSAPRYEDTDENHRELEEDGYLYFIEDDDENLAKL